MSHYISRAVTVALTVSCLALPGKPVGAQQSWTDPLPLNSDAYEDQSLLNESDPHIEYDGHGNWLAMWAHPNNTDLAFSHSHDAGASWGPGSQFNSTSIATTTTTRFVLAEAIHVYAGNNTWASAWSVERYHPSRGLYQIYTAYSTDNGTSWSDPLRLDLGGDTSQPLSAVANIQLASDGQGNLLGVFTGRSATSLSWDIFLVRSSNFGQTWSVPQKLLPRTGIPENADQVQVAYAGDNKWLLISTDVSPASIFYLHKYFASTSTNLGDTWTTSGPILQDYSEHQAANFEFHHQGDTAVVALYNDRSFTFEESGVNGGDGYQVIVSTNDGATFSAPIWLEHPLNLNNDPKLALGADSAGNWALAAHTSFSGIPAIYFASDPATSWTKTTVNVGMNDQLDIAGGGAGEFVSVMQHINTSAPPIHTDVDIASVRSVNAGATWSSPLTVNDSAATDNTQVRDSQVDLESGSNAMLSAWTATVTTFLGHSSTMFSRSETKGFYWDAAKELAKAPGSAANLVHVGGANWIAYWVSKSMISYSTDNGHSWTAPSTLPCELIASNQTGVLVRVRYNNLLSRSLDGGHTWEPEIQLAVSSVRHITHTGGNNWLAVGSANSILVSTDNATTWTPHGTAPFTIHEVAADKSGVVLATSFSSEIGPNNNDHVANTYVSRSTDGGITWSPLVLVHTQTRNLSGIIVLYGGSPVPLWLGGQQWAVFPKNVLSSRNMPLDIDHVRNADIFYVDSTDGGVTWNTPEHIVAKSGFDLSTGSDYAVMGNVVTVAYEVDGSSDWYEGDLFYINKIIRGSAGATDWSLFN